MHCRYGRNRTNMKRAIDKKRSIPIMIDERPVSLVKELQDKMVGQALLCESCNHWAMAAIIWHRIGAEDNAKVCESILQDIAINLHYKFKERKPVII